MALCETESCGHLGELYESRLVAVSSEAFSPGAILMSLSDPMPFVVFTSYLPIFLAPTYAISSSVGAPSDRILLLLLLPTRPLLRSGDICKPSLPAYKASVRAASPLVIPIIVALGKP